MKIVIHQLHKITVNYVTRLVKRFNSSQCYDDDVCFIVELFWKSVSISAVLCDISYNLYNNSEGESSRENSKPRKEYEFKIDHREGGVRTGLNSLRIIQ